MPKQKRVIIPRGMSLLRLLKRKLLENPTAGDSMRAQSRLAANTKDGGKPMTLDDNALDQINDAPEMLGKM